MKLWEQAVRNIFVWAAVYPVVLGFTYAFDALQTDVPLWLRVLVSTACTVPLISYVAIPAIERRIAHAQGESQADLKARQARATSDS